MAGCLGVDIMYLQYCYVTKSLLMLRKLKVRCYALKYTHELNNKKCAAKNYLFHYIRQSPINGFLAGVLTVIIWYTYITSFNFHLGRHALTPLGYTSWIQCDQQTLLKQTVFS